MKDQRFFVDKNITQHSAERTCDDTHYKSHPHGIVDGERLVYSDHNKHGETDTVEDEKHLVAPHEMVSENNHSQQRESRDCKIPPVVHPEYRDIKQYITKRTPADGGDKTYDICSEPVEILCGCKTDTAYRTRYCAYYFKNK